MADSLSIFGEGTFEEHVLELVKYLGRPETDETLPAFLQPFHDTLKVSEGELPLSEDEEKRKKVISLVVSGIKGLGEGNDREIEGFFNLVYAHLLQLYPPDSADSTRLVTALIVAMTSPTSPEHTPVKYRILSNLFNALPNRSTLRPRVYKALLDLATENCELDVLQIKMSDVEKWLDEWDISQEEKSEFLKNISDAFAACGDDETSYTYLVSYVRSISSGSAKAESAALDVIATSLRIPTVFNFDQLLKLNAVQNVKNHQLFQLLRILLEGKLSNYYSWLEKNQGLFDQFGLDGTRIEHKIRLLVLADLGAKNIGRDVPYSEIATALQIEVSQVEPWVIDIICARLLSGRLSQPNQTLHVTRSMSRSFTREEWETVEKRLVMWKSGLQDILDTVAAARKMAVARTTTSSLDVMRLPQPQVA